MHPDSSLQIESKLPWVGTTIFSVMSALAREHNALNLSQGFPNFDCPDELKDLVTHYMAQGYNQYAPMAGAPPLLEQLARKAHSLYGAQLDAQQEITITAGATQALFTAITAFVKTGDEVILIEPAYDSYRPAVELAGGRPVIYELGLPDYQIDWDQFADLISPRTRMIIVNSPHNPSGRVFSPADLKALQQLIRNTNILLLSDEVYEHLTYDGQFHQSVLRYPDLYQRSLAVFSFGKTFHNTGWKLGCCIAPPALTAEFRKVHQFNVFSVSTPMQYALADYLKQPDNYLQLAGFYQQKRDAFLEVLQNSRFRPLPCQGTYFQSADYSAISDEPDTEFAKRMTVEHGLAVIPVSVFYSSLRDEKVVRFCFAKTEDVLKKAGEILVTI
ncbi:MAG: methionine aminotransferase [Bacteroidota bacterium]